MKFTEILKMAFASLGANKLRSGLTMTGITIGVFSVIGVMTVVVALRSSIENGLSFLGSDIFQVTKRPSGFVGEGVDWQKINMRRDITLAQANRFAELMEGTTDIICFRVSTGGAKATFNARETTNSVQLVGTNEYYLNANKFTIEVGRNFTRDDVELGRPVVIIGQDLVSKLFPSESPIDQRIKIRARTYTVIGVFASKGTAFGQTQDSVAAIPVTRFLSDFGSRGRTLAIAVQAPNRDAYSATLDKMITSMRVARTLRPEDDNDFEVSSNDSAIASIAGVMNTLQTASLGISGIALLAAGVGIMNIMLVSVTERTKEIGVRKSIGARKVSILKQFLIEAVAISVAGGLMGILLGVAAGNGLALLMKATIVFPWLWAGAGIAVCTLIGVGFGFYPAWKAASLDPIEALRYE